MSIEELKNTLEQYKNDQITDFVLEKTLAEFLGNRNININVKVVEGKAGSQTSFVMFAIPERLTEGYSITFYLDKNALRSGIFETWELRSMFTRLVAHIQTILSAYRKFEINTVTFDVSFGYALAYLLALYKEYRDCFLALDKEKYLPDVSKLNEYIEKLKSGDELSSTIEALKINEYICDEIVDHTKKYVRENGEIKIRFTTKPETEKPVELGSIMIRPYATNDFGVRSSKEISYDYNPLTNQ